MGYVFVYASVGGIVNVFYSRQLYFYGGHLYVHMFHNSLEVLPVGETEYSSGQDILSQNIFLGFHVQGIRIWPGKRLRSGHSTDIVHTLFLSETSYHFSQKKFTFNTKATDLVDPSTFCIKDK